MTEKEVAALAAKTRDATRDGKFELFKTSDRFDGTSHKPQWMGWNGSPPGGAAW